MSIKIKKSLLINALDAFDKEYRADAEKLEIGNPDSSMAKQIRIALQQAVGFSTSIRVGAVTKIEIINDD